MPREYPTAALKMSYDSAVATLQRLPLAELPAEGLKLMGMLKSNSANILLGHAEKAASRGEKAILAARACSASIYALEQNTTASKGLLVLLMSAVLCLCVCVC